MYRPHLLSSLAAAATVAGVLILTAGTVAQTGQQQQPPPQQAPVFRSDSATVPVHVTVIDKENRLVTDLTRDDFEVYDNGKLQPLTVFDNSIKPIRMIAMLDVSGSMAGNMDLLRRSAVQMFTRLLPEDLARVGSFGSKITISEEFTNDPEKLIKILYTDLPSGGGTPLWNAIDQAMTALSGTDGRRVVLVLSDGRDNGFGTPGFLRDIKTLPDISKRAQTEEFMIYGIGLESRGGPATQRNESGRMTLVDSQPDPGLRDLAVDTGGGYFEIKQGANLGAAFARAAEELHRQYLLGFAAPMLDGKTHKIEVKVKKPGLTPRARRTYVAPKKSQGPAPVAEPRR